MQQFVDIFPEEFFRLVTGHLQQSVIAECRIPFRIHTAHAFDHGIQNQLQFRLQFPFETVFQLIRWHGRPELIYIGKTETSVEGGDFRLRARRSPKALPSHTFPRGAMRTRHS